MRKGEEVERVFSFSHGAEQEVSGPLTQKLTQKERDNAWRERQRVGEIFLVRCLLPYFI